MSSRTEFPDFSGIYKVYPVLAILSVNEIDADQAAALNEIIEKALIYQIAQRLK